MAAFTKYTVQLDSGVNTYDQTRVVDPPGFDAAVAQVRGRVGGGRAPGGGVQSLIFAAMPMPPPL